MLPRDNVALGVEADTLFDYPGIAEVFPRHLVFTGKLDAHRLTHRLRENGRIVGNRIRAV